MQVIIEGPDGSGKSTLIKELVRMTGWQLIPGEGPERYPGEMEKRVQRYIEDGIARERLGVAPVVFDRHPCVSHPIYSRYTNVTNIPVSRSQAVYRLKNFFIYCPGTAAFPSHHDVKPDRDTPTHLHHIERNHRAIRQAYAEWGLSHGHMIYRLNELTPVQVAAIIAASVELART